ncbi:MAG TPA: serine hydrolase domain-containing protein [Myxococcota bacterium]|nr:serine hydrolase domain-containing protein [Myxococcota bacterium]
MTWLLACTPKTLDVGGDDSSLLDSSDSAEILWDGCDRDDDWEELLSFVEDELEDNGVPGASVAVVCDGKLAYRAALGVRNEEGDPVEHTTRFQFASVTKMFTSALAMSLVEEGLVSLHDPVEVEGVNTSAPYDTGATLHHLLTHTSGYPTTYGDAHDGSNMYLESFFENNGDALLWSEPGAVWNYSNLGASLAGLVLEQAAGEPFASLVDTRIFGPAGMSRATLDAEAVEDDGDFAWGNTTWWDVDPIAPTDYYLPTGYYGPMGGAWGSASDLAIWGLAHSEDGAPLSEESWALLREAHTPTGHFPEQTHGYNLFRDTARGPTLYNHSGGVAGWLSYVVVAPDEGFAVAVLYNSDAHSPWYAAMEATEIFVGLEDLALGDYPARDGSFYAGTYESLTLGEVVVTEDSRISGEGVEDQAMNHLFDDYFAFSRSGTTLYGAFWGEGETAEYLATLYGVYQRP